jgi:hypothetical protein
MFSPNGHNLCDRVAQNGGRHRLQSPRGCRSTTSHPVTIICELFISGILVFDKRSPKPHVAKVVAVIYDQTLILFQSQLSKEFSSKNFI